MLNNSAITASADENDGIMLTSAEHDVTAPSVDGVQHRCMVAYQVTQKDLDGSVLYFRESSSSRYDAFSMSCSLNNSRSYVVMSSTTSTKCTPSVRWVRTYCPQYQKYSSYTSIASASVTESKYCTTGFLSTGSVISNKSTTLWYELGSNTKLHYSLAYNGEIVDGELTITPGGYNIVTIDSVSFRIKASDLGVAIRTTTSGASVTCNSYDTMFAYALVKE